MKVDNLTKREYFAGVFAQKIIELYPHRKPRDICTEAAMYADAMLDGLGESSAVNQATGQLGAIKGHSKNG